MHNRITWVLRIATSLMIWAGYLALSSDRNYGPGLLFIPLVLLPLAPVGAYIESKSRLWRLVRKTAALCYIFFIPISLQMLGLMDAVILLVIFIQAYLLLGEKTVRSYYELFLMSFFLLLAAVVQSPESLIAVALLLFGVSAVWAFATLRMHVEMTDNARHSQPELTPLAAGTNKTRQGNMFDFGLALSLSLLSILSIVMTIVVFILTPRVEAGWLGRRDSGQAVTGLSETVRITGDTSITEDMSVVMHVQFPDENQGRFLPESLLYWRVTTLPRFTADEWSRRGLHKHYEPGIAGMLTQARSPFFMSNPTEVKRAGRGDARNVRQVVYMDNVPTQGIPTLDLPQGLRINGEAPYTRVVWDPSEDFTLKLETRGIRSLQYEALSDMVVHDDDELRAAPYDYNFMVTRDYSLLTYHELMPVTQNLVQEITAEYESLYEKVKALEAWLSSPDFTYTLNIPPLPAANSIDAFVLTIREGHCELYASALALMTRSLGIPARVVSGYRGGEYDPADQAYLVRASMAHLWVEALFKDVGWVRFDPSPQSDVEATGFRRMQMAWSSYVLRGKMFWYQRVIGFQGGIRLEQLMAYLPWKRRPKAPQWTPETDVVEPDAPTAVVSAWELTRQRDIQIAAAVSITAGVLFLWRRRVKGRGRDIRLTADQARARKLYLRFLKKAASLGIACGNRSSGEIWEALSATPIQDRNAVRLFLDMYHEARFGGRPFTKAQARKALLYLQGMRKLKSP